MTTRLMINNPHDFRLKFNMALCLYNRANATFALPQRQVKQTEQAISDCKVATSLLNQFIALQGRTGGTPAAYLLPSKDRSRRAAIRQLGVS